VGGDLGDAVVCYQDDVASYSSAVDNSNNTVDNYSYDINSSNSVV
jgi:hypothetical protein